MNRAFTGTTPTPEQWAEERDLHTQEQEARARGLARFASPRSEVELERDEARQMVANFYWLVKNGVHDLAVHCHDAPGFRADCWGCRAEMLLQNAQEKGYMK